MFSQLRYLVPYLKRYRTAYVVGALCIVASVFLRLLVPRVIGIALNDLESSAATVTAERMLLYAGLLIGTALIGALTRTISRLNILGTSRKVAHDLRNVVFDHLLHLSPSFYVRNPTGQIMSRCINDMQNVQGLMGPVIMYLAETSILYVIGLAMMLSISPDLTLYAMLPFPFFLYGARKLAVRIQEGSRAAQNSLGEVSAKVDESLSGQMVIKTLTLEDLDLSRFEAHCRRYRSLNLGVTRMRTILIPLMMSLATLSIAIVLVVGGPRVVRGELRIGDLVTLLFYMRMFSGPTRTLGFVISSLRRGASALQRIREVMLSEVTLVDPPTVTALGADGPCDVRVDDLSVVYPPLSEQPHLDGSLPREHDPESDEERRVLDSVSFHLPAGKTLGIVGRTGAGKTTLVRAIARQLEVDPGHVFLDGTDVTELGLGDVRRRIGFVPQDAFLFSASLAENVALGRIDASRDDIEAAARSAQLTKDLEQLPDGLDTVVGERGVNLSGGQRQRTALARVLLLSPSLLILDDTLSAVDTHTADQIKEELLPFARERTTILVAHRLSTLQDADHILVLDEGRVVEEGDHAGLVARGGIYADLWRRQEERAVSATRAESLKRELGIEDADLHSGSTSS